MGRLILSQQFSIIVHYYLGKRSSLEYCRIQNEKGNTPLFIIADNPDFEYVACLHDADYKGQETEYYDQLNDFYTL